MEPRIYGPYKHRHRWRIVVYDREGQRSARICETYDEAAELVRELDAQLPASDGLRLATALERYAAFQAYKGNKPGSIATTNYRLRAFFADLICNPLRGLDRRICQRLYDQQVATTAVDTHQNVLGQVKTFFAWCVRHRYLSINPADRIRPVGKRQHGKPQLRVDEAREWMRSAESLAKAGKSGAIAAMMSLLMGMRCSEIVRCAARDVDDGGRLLWIPVSKTRSGKRVLEIPPGRRRHLVQLAKGQPPLTRLFPYERSWVRKWVNRICNRAGTPIVCAHAMRGLHSTLAIDAGMSPNVVAFSLGHKSPRATLLSYADPNAVARAKQRRVITVLGRGRSRT